MKKWFKMVLAATLAASLSSGSMVADTQHATKDKLVSASNKAPSFTSNNQTEPYFSDDKQRTQIVAVKSQLASEKGIVEQRVRQDFLKEYFPKVTVSILQVKQQLEVLSQTH